MRCGILHAVMKSITVVSTTIATEPVSEAKLKPAKANEMIRTIKVDFDQSVELSVLISCRIAQQRWAYNMAIRETLDDHTVTRFGLNNMLTKWRDDRKWLEGGIGVQRAGLAQGRETVLKFLESNVTKRVRRIMWKDMSRKYREKEEEKRRLDSDGNGADGSSVSPPQSKWSNKRNHWSHASDLFRKKGGRQALCVFEKPVPKGNNMVMLPGVGTVRAHSDMEGLDMRSFQLVETTKKTTRRTKDHHRTYRLHIQVGIEAPKPATSDVIRGVDMGIVYNATTVDLDTGYTEFHDIPDGSRRTKGDEVSKMQADLSRKRGGSGNRRIKACKGGANGGDKNTNGNNRNRPRKHKSRSYKDLQRKIQRRREKVANRQTNWERHASKKIADGAGTVAIEDLNVRNMTARARGRGSSAKTGLNREMAYSRPRTFLSQIEQTCKNMGVAVITVDPRGTSITCHRCGHKDRGSRISQAEFQCTNHDCECHINADVNAAHNIAVMATAGRQGLSSQGARFQAGIAPGRSVNNMRETSMGGIARAPEKGNGSVTEVYNSLKERLN